MKILGISGSLRAASLNTRLLRAAGELAQDEGAEFEIQDISAIPLYNSELDGENFSKVAAFDHRLQKIVFTDDAGERPILFDDGQTAEIPACHHA